MTHSNISLNHDLVGHQGFNSTSNIHPNPSDGTNLAYVLGRELLGPAVQGFQRTVEFVKDRISKDPLKVQDSTIMNTFTNTIPTLTNKINPSKADLYSSPQQNSLKNHQNIEASSLGIPLFSRLTHEKLKEKFANLGIIGGGGEASVYKVRHKESGKIFALRIDHEMRLSTMKKREVFFDSMIELQHQNPHLAKTIGVLWLENKDTLLSFLNVPKGDFVSINSSPEANTTTYYQEVTVMELGEQYSEKMKDIDPVIITIQQVFNHYCLDQMKIVSNDDKFRNYVWMPAEHERYNGHSLKDFKYWHYSFDELHIYIPRQNYILKRVDFNHWEKIDMPIENTNWSELLESKVEKEDIEKLHQYYSKPDVLESEILNMNSLLTKAS